MPINNRALMLLSFLAISVLALSGCASLPYPSTMTCSLLELRPITKPGENFDLVNFSVRLPQETDKWCIASSNIGFLTLFTHPLMGQVIDKDTPNMALNTIGMVAIEMQHESDKFSDSNDLRDYVEDWINYGFGAEGEPPNVHVKKVKLERFSLLQVEVETVTEPADMCVRYAYLSEEIDNPRAPDKILIQEDIGLVCQHPDVSSRIVVLGLSERFPRGGRIDPDLFNSLKENVASDFFNSLRF